MDCTVHRLQSQTQLSDCYFHYAKLLKLTRFSIVTTSMALTTEMHNIPRLHVKIFNKK